MFTASGVVEISTWVTALRDNPRFLISTYSTPLVLYEDAKLGRNIVCILNSWFNLDRYMKDSTF